MAKNTKNRITVLDAYPTNVLPEGRYVAVSGTPAYDFLHAQEILGNVHLMGERFLPATPTPLNALLVYVPDAGYAANPPEKLIDKRTMPLTEEVDYSLEKKAYSYWQMAWWREVIQNAVDAGATKILCQSIQNPDGTFTVSCQDNGRGMDQEIFLSKFLTVDASGKRFGEGKTGGFGKAKKLILFPWIGWTITTHSHSGGLLAKGVGREHDLWRIDAAPQTGTLVEVVMGQAWGDRTNIGQAESYIRKSYVPGVEFRCISREKNTYSGKEEITDKIVPAAAYGADTMRDIPSAEIRYSPSEEETSSNLWVRLNGLLMFERGVGTEYPGQIFVELKGKSSDILQDNRDGLTNKATIQEIDKLVATMAADKRSAFDKAGGLTDHRMIAGEASRLAATQAEANASPVVGRIFDSGGGGLDLAKAPEAVDTLLQIVKELEMLNPFAATPETVREVLEHLEKNNADRSAVNQAVEVMAWQSDYRIFNKDKRGFHIPKKFHIETISATVLRLAKVWAQMCRWILGALGSTTPFGIGFVFSDKVGGLCEQDDRLVKEGSYRTGGWLLFQPYKSYGDQKLYNPKVKEDLQYMFAIAIHECTHLADRAFTHNEDFSSAMTRNMAKCADGFRRIKRMANSTKLHGQISRVREDKEPRQRRDPSEPKVAKGKKLYTSTTTEHAHPFDAGTVGKPRLDAVCRWCQAIKADHFFVGTA